MDLSYCFLEFPPSADKCVCADRSWRWLQPFYAIFRFPLAVPPHTSAPETLAVVTRQTNPRLATRIVPDMCLHTFSNS